MKNKEDIERLIDETMNSLQHLQQVEVNPYLFDKIKARMHYKNEQQHRVWLKLLTGLSVVLVLLMAVNFMSYYTLKRTVPQKNSPQQTTATQAFASEYNLNQGGYNY